jgi:hypothetical protein
MTFFSPSSRTFVRRDCIQSLLPVCQKPLSVYIKPLAISSVVTREAWQYLHTLAGNNAAIPMATVDTIVAAAHVSKGTFY